MKKFFLAALSCLCLAGCLGYHIGPVKPQHLSGIHTIAIPTFKNQTLQPRIEVLVTGTVIKQFQQDGTYRIASNENADAVLEGQIINVSRSPARSVRGNVLATTEFNLVMRVKYRLIGRDGQPLGPQGVAIGTTSFFVGSDVATDERQAIPLASEQLAIQLVSQLSEGW